MSGKYATRTEVPQKALIEWTIIAIIPNNIGMIYHGTYRREDHNS
jgi:glutaminase